MVWQKLLLFCFPCCNMQQCNNKTCCFWTRVSWDSVPSHHAAEPDKSYRAEWAAGQRFLWSHYVLVKEKKNTNKEDFYLSSLPFVSCNPCFLLILHPRLSCLTRSVPPTHSQLWWSNCLSLGNIRLLQSPRPTCWGVRLLLLSSGDLGNRRTAETDCGFVALLTARSHVLTERPVWTSDVSNDTHSTLMFTVFCRPGTMSSFTELGDSGFPLAGQPGTPLW